MTSLSFNPTSDRIRLAQTRLRDAYARVPGATVPVVEPGGYARRYDYLARFNDLDKMLDHAVAWANALSASDNDWPPFIDTYVGVVMVAEAFGCQVVHTPGEDPWTEPAIGDIGQVWNLKPRKLMDTPTIRRLFEWIDYAQRQLGPDLPIWTMDIQSPFSVAAHIIDGTELMMACYTDPKAVHHLCAMITEFSIEFMQKHLAQMEHPGYPGRNFPSLSDNIGICIADDTPLIMLSPEMYREFALPYNNRLGEAFGGVHLHSCGNYTHNLDNVLTMTNLRSLQLHAGPGEFKLPESPDEDCPFNRARPQVALFVDSGDIARGDAFRNQPQRHYREYTLPRLFNTDNQSIILQSCGVGDDLPTVSEALDWTRQAIGAGEWK